MNDGSGEYLSLEACEKDCEVMSVIEDELYFNIYPNPSQDLFTLELKSNSIIDIHILNLLGEEILNYNINSKGKHKINLDISSYPKGVYNIYIKVNKIYYSRKLILQ